MTNPARIKAARRIDGDSGLPPLDRSEILKIRRRFLNLNRLRLKRVHDALSQQQRIFFDLLPLLFHTNHPLMPGYVDKDCPSGVWDFSPGRQSLLAANKLARSFSMPRGALRRVEIDAIYLMGSSGTIAHSSESDFDIWLCHREDTARDAVDKLRAKAREIERWASGLQLEVHFFVMSARDFRNTGAAELSSESSGSAQHYLLLDEFYRTGLLIAGRAPLWWLVPPEFEGEYADFLTTIVRHRYIKPHDYLDFGTVNDIEPAEFFGATLWHLSKAVEAPYKSLLKILLLETYATDYPSLDLLSTRFKRGVYAGRRRVEELDPYVLLYDKVEGHLKAQGELERLELARRCLYFKASLTNEELRRAGDWRAEIMAGLTQEWGWNDEMMQVLDARCRWKVDRTLEERKALVSALTHGYKLLSVFAREHAQTSSVSDRDMTVLGRKLFTAFEHKSGKVDIVNRGISQDLSESHLYLRRVRHEDARAYWLLYRNAQAASAVTGDAPLRRGRTAMELIAWSHFNCLMTGQTRVVVEEGASARDLEVMTAQLRRYFPPDLGRSPGVDALAASAHLLAAGTFVNFGADPLPTHARRGNVLTSNRSDALSFSSGHENLVHELDYLVVTSWGEILTHNYSGMDGLMTCLCEHLRWLSRGAGQFPQPEVHHCCSPRYAETIVRRISSLFEDVTEWFMGSNSAPKNRYIVRGGDRYFVLTTTNHSSSYDFSGSYSELLQHLGQPNPMFTNTSFDPHALDDPLLRCVFARNLEGVVQFFYRVDGKHAVVQILDEKGALLVDRFTFYSENTLLSQYSQFLQAVDYRQRSSQSMETTGWRLYSTITGPTGPVDESESTPVEFYQVVAEAKSYRLRQVDFGRFPQANKFLDVKVIGEVVDGDTEFTVYCKDHEFSTREHGTQLFNRVTDHILTHRQGKEPYPIYITDLDLSWLANEKADEAGVQTIHFLKYKKRIEHKLNEVLRARRRLVGRT